MSDDSSTALVSGGGTAGHVLPALSIAEALVARGWSRSAVHFMGAARGQERELVPAAGFTITLLPGRGIQRRLTLANLGAIAGLVQAFATAVREVRRRRPAVCVTVGGYASVAGALASFVWRVPVVVAEQNARASAANRLAGKFARFNAVAFPDTDLPRAVLCGNPVRAEVIALRDDPRREATRTELGVRADQRLIVAFGGSLGARRINEAVEDLATEWVDRSDLFVYHVVGARDFDRPTDADAGTDARATAGENGLTYRRVRYDDALPAKLAAADVVVSRSGATTVAELTVLGVAAILVPLPHAPRDHQAANAAHLVEHDAARVIDDSDLEPRRLGAELTTMLAGSTASDMAAAARSLGHPDAADKIADLVERAARESR